MQNHYGLVIWLAAGVYENKIDLCGKYPWRNDVLLGGYETYLASPPPVLTSQVLLLEICVSYCLIAIISACIKRFLFCVFACLLTKCLEPEVRERTVVAQFVLKMSLLTRFVAALPRHVHSAAALLGTLC